MKKLKKEIRWFSIMEYEKEEKLPEQKTLRRLEIQERNIPWAIYI